jgi:uncharacterized protein (DUF433 family)
MIQKQKPIVDLFIEKRIFVKNIVKMTVALRKIETLLRQISPSEKAQVLQWVVNDLDIVFPGIEKTEGVCGGAARIVRTRIPVWSLVRQLQLGITEVELLMDYPTLKAEDLKNAWQYFRTHKTEIEQLINQNEEA